MKCEEIDENSNGSANGGNEALAKQKIGVDSNNSLNVDVGANGSNENEKRENADATSTTTTATSTKTNKKGKDKSKEKTPPPTTTPATTTTSNAQEKDLPSVNKNETENVRGLSYMEIGQNATFTCEASEEVKFFRVRKLGSEEEPIERSGRYELVANKMTIVNISENYLFL
jgi:hypothetical protein